MVNPGVDGYTKTPNQRQNLRKGQPTENQKNTKIKR